MRGRGSRMKGGRGGGHAELTDVRARSYMDEQVGEGWREWACLERSLLG